MEDFPYPIVVPDTLKKDVGKNLFKLTYAYSKGIDRGIGTLLAGIAAVEDLLISNANVLSVVEANKESLTVAYSDDFEYVDVGYADGAIRRFKSHTMEMIQTLIDDDITEDPGPVTCVKHKPSQKNAPSSNTLISSYTNGCVKCWDPTVGQCLFTIKEKRQTYTIAYHPRLPKFVTTGDDSKINLYDEESKIQERVFSSSNSPGLLDGHTSRVFAACFNPHSYHELVTGGWDDVVHFWDFRQPFSVRHISGVHVCGDGLDISPSGTELLTCAWQTSDAMKLWDYGSGKLIQVITPDSLESKLYCGRYINKDYAVCGGTEPNIVRLVDMKNFGVVASINKLPGAVYALDIGTVKKSKTDGGLKKSKSARKSGNTVPVDDSVMALPKIVLSSSRRIYQIDFS